MEFNPVTQTAYLSGAITSFILFITLVFQGRKIGLPWSLSVAALIQTVWLGFIAHSPLRGEHFAELFLIEAFHYISWVFALTQTADKLCIHSLPKNYRRVTYIICSLVPVVSVGLYSLDIENKTYLFLIFWQGLILSILGLLAVEQLYRNHTHFRVIKIISLSMAAVFIFDAYLFAQDLLLEYFYIELWQARAAVSVTAATLIIIGLLTLSQSTHSEVELTFSRPAIFYTTSFTIAGALLAILSFGSYYVKLYGGDWATVIHTVLLVSVLLLIGLVLTSKSFREKINVLINKHLFNYKYDYRAEWINLINQLSREDYGNDPGTRVINVASNLFKCDAGAIWIKKDDTYVVLKKSNIQADLSNTVVKADSPFCKALAAEWVFSPRASQGDLSLNNELLPQWTQSIPNVQMIFPLLIERNLSGFILLTCKEKPENLTWEDLDLIKTVGRQFANYVKRHQQEEQLMEVRQFDAFNKLSAFVMHDLKNLIAQQSLVVKNAEKHKDNPAFVEDAINTINNSVVRMNNLLRKLQHNEPAQAKALKLKDVLIDAVKRCQKLSPVPTLTPVDPAIRVTADMDSLVMVFTHIIHNAQDATKDSGFIDIVVNSAENFVTVEIEDNGAGMDEDFINNKLFKPFQSTKSGKGMGVGAYQVKEYITSLGGTVSVSSQPDIGTTFKLKIPTS